MKAGTATANTAPLKFSAGTNLTTPEEGAVEFDGTNLYFTDNTNTRKTLATTSGGSFTEVSSITGSGALSVSSGGTNQDLTLSGSGTGSVISNSTMVVNNSTSSTSPTTGAMTVSGGMGVQENIYAGGDISSAGVFIAPLGTAAAPSYTFSGDLNTGVFSPGADIWGISTGGSERVRVDSAGRVGIGTTNPLGMFHVKDGDMILSRSVNDSTMNSLAFNKDRAGTAVLASDELLAIDAYGHDGTSQVKAAGINVKTDAVALGSVQGRLEFSTRDSSTSYTPKMTILSDGKVGIGTTTPAATLDIVTTGAPIQLTRNSDNAFGTHLLSLKSRGTVSVPTMVQSNDEVSTLWGRAYDGSAYQTLARMKFVVDGTTGVGDMPGRIEFTTTPDGASAEQIRMTIKNDGKIGIGTTNPSSQLEVNGDVRLSNESSLISSGLMGAPNDFKIRLSHTGYQTQTGGASAPYNDGMSIESDGAIYFSETDANAIKGWMDLNVGNFIWNGKVGIGVTAPTANLHLKAGTATANTAPLKLTQGTNLTTPEPGAVEYDGTNLYFTDSTSTRRTIASTSGANFSGAITTSDKVVSPYVYGSSSASGNLVIDSTTDASKGDVIISPSGGDVGIGTSSPVGMLSNSSTGPVDESAVGIGSMGLNWSGVSSGYVAAFENKSTGANFNGVLIKTADTTSTSQALDVVTGGVSRLVVEGSGNVGIGTNSPDRKLHVMSNGTLNSSIRLDGFVAGGVFSPLMVGSDFGSLIEGGDNAQIVMALKDNDANDGFRVISGGGNFMADSVYDTAVFTALSSGNVGVGTTTPAAKFEVQGGTDPVAIRLTETTGTHANWEMRSYNTAIAGANNQFSIWGGLAGSTQTDRFVIDPNGNVGVGTTAPGAKLDVSTPTDGSATALKLTSGDGAWVANQELRLDFNQNLSTVGRIAETYYGPDWGMNFYGYNSGLNTSPVLTLRGSGNVGVGTTNPGAKLHVAGPAAFENSANDSSGPTFSFWKTRNYSATLSGDELGFISFFGRDTTGLQRAAYIVAKGDGAPTAGSVPGYLGFHTTSASATDSSEKMRIAANGNVGIGTNAPAAKLDVFGSSYFAGRKAYINYYNVSPYDQAEVGAVGATTSLSLVTNGISRMNIDPAGNVGVGTAAPSQKLHVVGAGLFTDGTSNIGLLNRADSTLDINTSDAKRSMSIHHYGTSGTMVQWYYCPSGVCAQKFIIDTAGNVAIAGTLTQSSDERLKKDIDPLSDSLNKILSLQGVSYYWKDSPDKNRQIGLIAQDVQKVFPEAVKKNEDGFLSVGYQNLVAPIIEAIRELSQKADNTDKKYQREIASLKEENELLRKQNEDFEKRLEALEAKSRKQP